MKLCDRKCKEHQLRIKLKREKSYKKKTRKQQGLKKEQCDYFVLTAPELFDLVDNDNRKRVLHFLSRLKDFCINRKSCVSIDFRPTKKMYADGTLLLTAEIQRILEITKRKMACIPPRDLKVKQVLKQVGLLKQLHYNKNIETTFDDVVHWKVAHGTGAEGEKYDDILGHYDGVIPEELGRGLYLGLTEAMTNAHHHAYIDSRNDGAVVPKGEKGWWMFSQFKDDYLTVVFCDLGIGIPRSLPIKRPGLWGRLKSTVGILGDGHLIAEAVNERRTRTKKSYRGKGLQQLVSVIHGMKNATLHIHSNQGRYADGPKGEQIRNYDTSIFGTLIGWRVPVEL